MKLILYKIICAQIPSPSANYAIIFSLKNCQWCFTYPIPKPVTPQEWEFYWPILEAT